MRRPGYEHRGITGTSVDEWSLGDPPVRTRRVTINRINADARIEVHAAQAKGRGREPTLRGPDRRKPARLARDTLPLSCLGYTTHTDVFADATEGRLEHPLLAIAPRHIARIARVGQERSPRRHRRTQRVPGQR